MIFGKNKTMNYSRVLTPLSLLFAPLFLLYIHFYGIDKDSFFYISARMIPSLISLFFFLLFLSAYLSKKALVLSFTKRFYKKILTGKEEQFLKNSDLYWAFITFLNVVIQTLFGLFSNDYIWAFYSSIGWYIYFFTALTVQIIYGKWYNIDKEERE